MFTWQAQDQQEPTILNGQQASVQQASAPRPAKVDYEGFLKAATELEEYRSERLVSIERWLEMAKQPETLILDTRSKEAFDRKHVAGAVHLNFSDFTEAKLAKVIPSKETRILIYCNNNFDNDPVNFATKSVTLALNVPTFINLHGYGYENLYELSVLLDVEDERIRFAGTDVE
jgi:3-mercaptopyruvate sulfurtransferase SseA